MTSPKLIYCYDPMCSWCWGFQPTWNALKDGLEPMVERGEIVIEMLLGGLAQDSDEPMPIEMQTNLQAVWRQIESQLGTEFNHQFWQRCQPRRSTYPACRACLAAREQGLETEMASQIQQAYYLNAENPSDMDTLAECAQSIGMNKDQFLIGMQQIKESADLEREIRRARQMGLNSFPSLTLVRGEARLDKNEVNHINLDYQNANTMLAEIKEALRSI